MEKIHLPDRRGWIDKKPIKVRKFLEEWAAVGSECWNESNHFQSSASNRDQHLTGYECRLDALKCDYEDKVELYDGEIELPDSIDLCTLKFQRQELAKRKANPKYLTAHGTDLKYSNYPPRKLPKIECKGKESRKFKPIDPNVPEVILTVQIHAPERRLDPNIVNFVRMPQFHVDQEFNVLGSQYLTELREAIDCISDKSVPGDYSDNPHIVPTLTYKDIYKSGFFYINGVFYNDMRDKDCRDYSEPIIQWSKKRNDIGPFSKAPMEGTRFVDLTIQLGYPYVYVHQGDCEHLIVFSDLRLLTKNDNLNRNAYPMYTKVRPSKRIFCMVCHVFTAVWVVYDNKRLPENPYFFCKTCFFSFNYDENDQKIGEFKAYHYPDRSILF